MLCHCHPVKESFAPDWSERFRWLRLCGHDINERALNVFRRNLDDIRSRFFKSPPSISLPACLGGLGIPLDYPRCSACRMTNLWSVYKRCSHCHNASIEDYTPYSLNVYKMTPVDSFWDELDCWLLNCLGIQTTEELREIVIHGKKHEQWSGYQEQEASWHEDHEGWEQVESWMDRVERLEEPKEQVGIRDSSRIGRVPYSSVEYVDLVNVETSSKWAWNNRMIQMYTPVLS